MNVYLQARPAMQTSGVERQIRKEGNEPYPAGWPRVGGMKRRFRWCTVTESGFHVVTHPDYDLSVPIGEVPPIVDAWVRDRIFCEWEWRVLRAEPPAISDAEAAQIKRLEKRAAGRKTTLCCARQVPAAGGSRPQGERWECPTCNRIWIHVVDEAEGACWEEPNE